MDYLHRSKLPLVLCGLLSIIGCSNSDNGMTQEPDSRPTMAQFMSSHSEPQDIVFSSEETANSTLAANRVAISYLQHSIDNNAQDNVVLTPWPMFSTLALATAASHGDTADQINYELNAFGLEQSWPLAYQALHQSQTHLLTSGTSVINLDLWSQFDSQFETEFLQQIGSAFQAHSHSVDFKAGEDIAPELDHLAIRTFGENFSFYIENYSNTRLLMLNQIKTVGSFDTHTLHIERFDGLFENEADELIRAPMIRIQGKLDYYENSELIAYRLPLESNKLSVISIQPKDDMHAYIANNLETVLSTLNSSWIAQDSETVLPLIDASYTFSNDWLADWKDTNLLYSEELADLRSMDHKGGLYLQDLPWKNRFSISDYGIELAGISGHAATFSERNFFWSEPVQGDLTFHDITIVYETPPACSGAIPDISTGLILIQNTETGLIQSMLHLKTLAGTVEGITGCIYFDEPN